MVGSLIVYNVEILAAIILVGYHLGIKRERNLPTWCQNMTLSCNSVIKLEPTIWDRIKY